MPATMKKTVSVDRLLAQKADAKLRQYGWTLDDAFARTLVAIVTVSGEPEFAFANPLPRLERRRPGGLRGRIRISPEFDETSAEITDLFEHSSV